MVILCLGLLILVVIIMYIYFLGTNQSRKEDFTSFKKNYIAHRGLFDNKSIPENSEPAFKAAVENGYGIELDVQLSKDGKLVVFHDASLKRMCGIDKRLADCTYEELFTYGLGGTDERIPVFENMLKTIDGRVPLVVEIKSEGNYMNTTKMIAKVMDSYKGPYCIESFNPRIVAWFRKNRPEVIRGILSTHQGKLKHPFIENFVSANILLNWYSRPDFIAYNHKYRRSFSYRVCKKIYHPVNVAWTIRSQDELDKAKEYFDAFIFDSFIPD